MDYGENFIIRGSNALQNRIFIGFNVILFLVFGVSHIESQINPLSYNEKNLTIGAFKTPVQIPKDYVLEMLVGGLRSPRMITFNEIGDLFIGSGSGIIYRLESPYTVAKELVRLSKYPHSVAFRNNEILIAQTDGVYRASYRSGQANIVKSSVELFLPLPGGFGGHNSRTVRISKNGLIYVSLGITGNCSNQYLGSGYPFTSQRGGVFVLKDEGLETMKWHPFASGLRNPVDFAWHPVTDVMYATNNGPDHLGYNQPPEYFSRLTEGSFHGMPWFVFDGDRLIRDKCISVDPPQNASAVRLPVVTFPSRNAPLGMTFVPTDSAHQEIAGDAIVALHGSWATQPSGGGSGNRSTRRPPKLAIVRFQDNSAFRVEDFVTGFQLPNGARWARPAGVAVGPKGGIYFTSDAGIEGLFRLRFKQDF